MYDQARRVEEALKLFGQMLERGEKPSAIAVNSMLAAFARNAPNFWKHAKAIFEVSSIRVTHHYVATDGSSLHRYSRRGNPMSTTYLRVRGLL